MADPIELPVRRPGDAGPSALARAEVLSTEAWGVTLKAVTTDGETLVGEVSAAGEGILRVRLSADPEARSRSARALPLVRPGRYAGAQVEADGNVLRVDAGAIIAEITLDPWTMRFLDADGRVLTAQNPGEQDISGRTPYAAVRPVHASTAPWWPTTRPSPLRPTSTSSASARSSPSSTSAASGR